LLWQQHCLIDRQSLERYLEAQSIHYCQWE
jgi:hypothetical protein